jgi:hypothetical protein
MDKSVQDFLQIAAEGSYFETEFGRFVFIKRGAGGIGYEIVLQGFGGLWIPIAVFKVAGKLQPAKTKQINMSKLGL